MAGGITMSRMTPSPVKPVGHNAKICLTDADFACEVLTAILTDGYNLVPSYKLADYLKDAETVRSRLSREGIGFATVALPRFFSDFSAEIEGGKPSYQGFRKRKSRSLDYDGPAFMSGLLVRVLNHMEDDTAAFDVVYSVCHAFKKLKGPYHPSVQRKNIAQFIAVDESLGKIDFRSEPLAPIIDRAKTFIDTLFQGVDDDLDLRPCPGPGATNSPTEHHMRYEPHVVYAQLEDQFPADEWFYSHPWDVVLRAREYLTLPRVNFPTSRFKFVHKYVGKPRGICIEENETQWCQQALKGYLYQLIENHSMTRGRVNFADQKVNGDLALRSSDDMSYATIDMSEASDRVSRELVHRLFIDTPIFEMLDAVSTRVITFPKELGVCGDLKVQKFAPMGSAVCFPVMALVHFALIKAIVQMSAPGYAKEASKHVFVYGDDIIVPRGVVQAVFDYLPLFGMKVNEDKSFHRSRFRESCGVHAYKGVNVTPVYMNYTLTAAHERKDTTRLLSLVAKEDAYYRKRYASTARVIREHTTLLYGQIPFVDPDSPLLGWKREGCDHTLHQKVESKGRKFDADTQSFKYKLRCVVPKGKRNEVRVEATRALLRWHVKPPYEEDADTFVSSPEDFRVVWRWMPELALG